jgi:hypothetical protein
MRKESSTQRTKPIGGDFGKESNKPKASYQTNVKSASLSRWVNPNQLASLSVLDRRAISQ